MKFFDVPLMAVLAALVAGSAVDDRELPQGRARLVVAVIDMYIKHWEGRRGQQGLAVASLDPASAIAAMQESYGLLSHTLNPTGSVAVEDARRLLADHLLDRYAALRGPAEQAASQLIWAWQESGVLSVSSAGTLRAGLRTFVEVGEAVHAISAPESLADWVTARVGDPDRHAELMLAAELCGEVADVLADKLEAVPAADVVLLADLSALVADAVGAHAGGGGDGSAARRDAALARLRAAVSAGLSCSAEDDEVWTGGTEDERLRRWALWSLAEQLIDAAAEPAQADSALTAALPRPLALLAQSSVWARALFGTGIDDVADPEQVTASLDRLPDASLSVWAALIEDGPGSPPLDPRLTGIAAALAPREHRATIVTAAAAVLPSRPDLASAVHRLWRSGGGPHNQQLEALLERQGHGALLQEDRRAEQMQAAQARRRLGACDDLSWLERLAGSHRHARLSDAQRWRLRELGALAAVYDLPGRAVGEHAMTLRQAGAAHARLDGIAIRLLGLDPGAVAAQAAQLLESGDVGARRRAMMTLYQLTAVVDPDWTYSDDPDADRRALLEIVAAGVGMLVSGACLLLSTHPEQEATGRLLAAGLPGLRDHAQFQAAMYAGHLGGPPVRATLADSPSALMRAAAGRLLMLRPDCDNLDLEMFAADPDATVRALTFSDALPDPPSATVEAVRRRAGEAGPAEVATCVHCGHEGPAAQSCVGCGLTLPEPAAWMTNRNPRTESLRRRRRPRRRRRS